MSLPIVTKSTSSSAQPTNVSSVRVTAPPKGPLKSSLKAPLKGPLTDQLIGSATNPETAEHYDKKTFLKDLRDFFSGKEEIEQDPSLDDLFDRYRTSLQFQSEPEHFSEQVRRYTAASAPYRQMNGVVNRLQSAMAKYSLSNTIERDLQDLLLSEIRAASRWRTRWMLNISKLTTSKELRDKIDADDDKERKSFLLSLKKLPR